MRLKRIWIMVTVLVFMACAGNGYTEDNDGMALPLMRVHQIDVGCAAAYMITVEDTVVLVDCGNDTDAHRTNVQLLAYLAESGIDHVDAHFVSHYHNDHAMNIDVLSELYGKDETVVYGPSEKLPERFLPLPKGTYRQMKENDEVDIGPLRFLCIGPDSADVTGERNYDSLNILMTYGENVFMFTGDYVANDMAIRHGDLLETVDVLSFPHHGLRPFVITSVVLSKMPASVVLVPANAAGEVRSYCRNAGLKANVYGSGQFGTVIVESDGVALNVVTER